MTEAEREPREADGRRLRADARRNEDAVLAAAKAVFAEQGVDAPVRDIALRAGIGLGTLYRRFPTRADLIAGVFRREVDACAAEAAALAARHPPLLALRTWLLRYAAFIGTKRGLARALHSGDPAYAALPDYFRARFEPALAGLVDAAAASGAIRAAPAPYDLLRAVGNLAAATGEDGAALTEAMIGLIVDGLRFRAAEPRA